MDEALASLGVVVPKPKRMDETTVVSVSATSNSELLTEKAILKEWEEANVYLRLLERAGPEQYVIQEMPSSIDGLKLDTFKCKIHQDVFLKFHLMQGEGVTYAPSWNYYTPAVERHVLNEAAKDVPKDATWFRKECRQYLQQQLELQRQQFHALGIFGDWAVTNKKLDTRYEWQLINAFNKLRDNGYLTKDTKLGYWCQNCNTALSINEIEIRSAQVYSAYVKFPVSEGFEELGANVHVGVWVEDLWHLAGSIALGIKKDSQCLVVEFEGDSIICAEEDFKNYVSEAHRERSQIIKKIKADELISYTCVHPFLGTMLSIVEAPDLSEDSDELLAETDSRGADLLQLVPGHRPMDYRIAQTLNLPIRAVVDDTGHLTDDADLFCGLNITEAGQFIALELEKRGYLICGGVDKRQHPHCWTCDSQALFRPVQQWIFSLDNNQLRHRLLHSDRFWENYNEKNREWMKQTIQNLPNLSVSCYRGWSSPLPIFQCDKCNNHLSDKRVLKTVRDITSRRGTDVWFKLSVDELLPSGTVCPNCESKEFQKESALLDGHFAMLLYTINNKSDVKRTHIKHTNVAFFSDNQFSRWFAQLALTSLALHDTRPFKYLELIQVGAPEHPIETAADWMVEYPTDVLRILGIHPDFGSPSLNELLQGCEQEYTEIRSQLCAILDELADFDPNKHRLPLDMLLPLDALALSATNNILQSVDLAYQDGRFYEAWHVLVDFCKSHFEPFYLPLLKERFKTETEGDEKQSGQTVLWEVLRLFVQRFAPIVPFLCEQIHDRMRHDWRVAFPPEQLTEPDVPYTNSASRTSEAVEFSSIFLEDWIAPVEIPHIADVDAQWAELSKSVGGS